MEFRLRPLGFMDFFKTIIIRQLFKKKLHETQGSQSKFRELNVYIKYIFIYNYYIYIYIYILSKEYIYIYIIVNKYIFYVPQTLLWK